MATKFDEIVEQLTTYRNRFYSMSIEECKEIATEHLNLSFNNPNIKNLITLIKDEIYPYINNNHEIKDIFKKRVDYYKNLMYEDAFVGIETKLYNEINELYSFINLDNASNEDNLILKGYCQNAIKRLSIDNELFNEKDFTYKKIVDLISNQKNFYKLDLNQDCKEIWDKTSNLKIFKLDNFLDIDKIIGQYKALLQPIDVDLINDFPELINETSNFEELIGKYKINLSKFENALIKDFGEQGLCFFCQFDKFAKCKTLCNPEPKSTITIKCLTCSQNVLFVLEYLINYFTKINNKVDKDYTDQEKRLLSVIEEKKVEFILSIDDIIYGCGITARTKDIKKKRKMQVKSAQNLVAKLRTKRELPFGEYDSYDQGYPMLK